MVHFPKGHRNHGRACLYNSAKSDCQVIRLFVYTSPYEGSGHGVKKISGSNSPFLSNLRILVLLKAAQINILAPA
ncbi:hypothetical protein MSBRM_3244 [Methanosarcina barkeri MS]|uniref:Uncharacterized protein n=1 Tax=Methanosarcina barkeri MS TaxID=1434108 RepID=A0A0E3QZ77_METBA|nr:hypothetical protein MSBRM_3244 [Methanosarcina barkeri MS]